MLLRGLLAVLRFLPVGEDGVDRVTRVLEAEAGELGLDLGGVRSGDSHLTDDQFSARRRLERTLARGGRGGSLGSCPRQFLSHALSRPQKPLGEAVDRLSIEIAVSEFGADLPRLGFDLTGGERSTALEALKMRVDVRLIPPEG
jgi:hypothetical protein